MHFVTLGPKFIIDSYNILVCLVYSLFNQLRLWTSVEPLSFRIRHSAWSSIIKVRYVESFRSVHFTSWYLVQEGIYAVLICNVLYLASLESAILSKGQSENKSYLVGLPYSYNYQSLQTKISEWSEAQLAAAIFVYEQRYIRVGSRWHLFGSDLHARWATNKGESVPSAQ